MTPSDDAYETIEALKRKVEELSGLGERTYYIDGVDWQHEIGETPVMLYKTPAKLERAGSCAHQCGIVKVTVIGHQWVKEQDFDAPIPPPCPPIPSDDMQEGV